MRIGVLVDEWWLIEITRTWMKEQLMNPFDGVSVGAPRPSHIGQARPSARTRLLPPRMAALAAVILLAVSTMGFPAIVLAAGPTNDNLTSATAIGSLPYSDLQDNTEATIEPGEGTWCPYVYGNRTVWYSMTLTTERVLQASLAGSSFYDQYIAVYAASAPGFGGLAQVTCATYDNPVTFKAHAGTTYYLQVGDQWSGGGDLQLTVREVIPPTNDDFESSRPIEVFPFTDTVDISNATLETGEPAGCQQGYPYQKSVWYAITPESSGALTFSAVGLGDVELSAHTLAGSGLGGLTPLQCRYQSSLTFPVSAGQTYYLLARTTVSTSGSLELSGSLTLPPANDLFAEATSIQMIPFSDVTSNAASTTEPNEPACPDGGHGSVWYSVEPSATGSLSVRATSSFGAGPVVGVYQGADVASLTQRGCASDSSAATVTFPAIAGSTYLIQVGARFYPVDIQVDVFPTPAPVADFWWGPENANVFTSISFADTSSDPGGVGFGPAHWTFGDGSSAVGSNVNHTYSEDGDFTVSMTTTTQDGRSATTSKVVPVRTHDIGIVKFSVPTSARAGQTRTITVGVGNRRYAEVGVVTVWKGAFPNQQVVAQLEGVTIPVQAAGKTTNFSFNYTFTAQDVAVGKVTFGAAVGIWIAGIPDAYPADNAVIATPTRVMR